ncbi:hypothetical protein V8C42DRAFT_286313 [Trichoderma barbatum]
MGEKGGGISTSGSARKSLSCPRNEPTCVLGERRSMNQCISASCNVERRTADSRLYLENTIMGRFPPFRCLGPDFLDLPLTTQISPSQSLQWQWLASEKPSRPGSPILRRGTRNRVPEDQQGPPTLFDAFTIENMTVYGVHTSGAQAGILKISGRTVFGVEDRDGTALDFSGRVSRSSIGREWLRRERLAFDTMSASVNFPAEMPFV